MLTDTAVRKAKSLDKAYKLTDSNGLYIYITPAGSKIWRYRYYYSAKEKILVIGNYPEVSLVDARRARDEARALLNSGKDPALAKKLEKAIGRRQTDETFRAIAEEWHEHTKSMWTDIHGAQVLHGLKRDVFHLIGDLPIKSVDAPTILGVLRLIEKRGAVETAKRTRQRISAVFVYAISTGRASADPAAIVQGAMAHGHKSKQPAIVSVDEVRIMLRAVNATPGNAVTKLAIRVLCLTAVRPGVLAATPWSEWQDIDPANPFWRIPASRMKLRKDKKGDEQFDHIVPLSKQVLETIDVLRKITGRRPYVFPNIRRPSEPMCTNAMGYFLNRAGYHARHVPHGFRSSFSSIMNERFPQDFRVIDLMLAHSPKDKIEGAYNRAQHLEKRTELAQAYADLIMKDAPTVEEFINGPIRINKKGDNPAPPRRKWRAA